MPGHLTRTLGLRALAAAGLLVSAYVHLRLAPRYDLLGGQITVGALFRVQAVLAVVAVLVLAVRRPMAWWPAAVVAAASLVALVGTVYVQVPSFGPLPAVYEPVWFTDKVVASVAAAVSLGCAAGAGLLSRRGHGRR